MDKNFLDIAISRGLIKSNEAEKFRREARQKRRDIFDELLSHGYSEKELMGVKSELLDIPVKNFPSDAKVPFEVLREIPEQTARFYKFVPLGRHRDVLEIGMVNPDDVRAQEALRFLASRLNVPFDVYLIAPSDFDKIISGYKGLGGEVSKALGELELDLGEGIVRQAERATKDVVSEEAPISKIVAVIIKEAIDGKASDIHIEPSQDKLRIRFRVDGVLYSSLFLPTNVHPAIVSRIKILCNLKIDETRLPQDGRFRAKIEERDVDFRVSTFPTSYGEKVVIRILDPQSGVKELSFLGVQGRNLEILTRAIDKPFGMILITGPTGSGKTTTLYAILQILNDEKVNIVSLEDPIEYNIGGVNQSQVNPEIGYDFATGLRHILRQDPDVILVGEIRDKETAGLAVHAALTGHLVLATLHTNNTVGVMPRLIDMGVDPFLIPSTLILAIAQRLVRKLCPDSREKFKPTGALKEIIDKEIESFPHGIKKADTEHLEIYRSKASPDCPIGTKGRLGIFEMLEMTPQLEEIVLSGPSETKITTEAKRQNMLTMRQDGFLKVLEGSIGVEELMEVV